MVVDDDEKGEHNAEDEDDNEDENISLYAVKLINFARTWFVLGLDPVRVGARSVLGGR
jgi:hypothetical protein